jgi:hypothetical protein
MVRSWKQIATSEREDSKKSEREKDENFTCKKVDRCGVGVLCQLPLHFRRRTIKQLVLGSDPDAEGVAASNQRTKYRLEDFWLVRGKRRLLSYVPMRN